MSKRIYVGNLPWSVAKEGLEELFSSFGEIEEALVIANKYTGRSRGFGFVTYKNDADADKAMKDMNEKEVEGRRLVVKLARPSRESQEEIQAEEQKPAKKLAEEEKEEIEEKPAKKLKKEKKQEPAEEQKPEEKEQETLEEKAPKETEKKPKKEKPAEEKLAEEQKEEIEEKPAKKLKKEKPAEEKKEETEEK